jgi:hypothetical protein
MKLHLDPSLLVAAFSPEAFTNRALTVTETRISLIRKRKRGAMAAGEVAAARPE